MKKELLIKTNPDHIDDKVQLDSKSMNDPENLTLSQLETLLPPIGKLIWTVLQSLGEEQEYLLQKILNAKYPLRASLDHNVRAVISKTTSEDGDNLLVRDVAQIMHLSPIRIRELAQKGRFVGARKIGRDWSIPVFSIATFEHKKPGRPRKDVKGYSPNEYLLHWNDSTLTQ